MATKKAETKKPVVLTGDVIDITPDNPEVALIVKESEGIPAYLATIRSFVLAAKELEARASADLVEAHAWKKPTNGDEDRDLVAKLRANTTATHEIESKWEVIKSIHRLYRQLTAMRDRGINIRKEIATRGAQLHSQFEADEKRRVEEANRRRQEEADRIARENRQRELDAMEAKAAEAERASPELSAREERFVDIYMRTENGVTAARTAGYPKPDNAALRLLSTEKITKAIEAKRQAAAIREQAEARKAAPVIADEIVEEKADVAKGGREYWSAEVYDRDALIAAMLDPTSRMKHGIPSDLADYKQTVLTELARQMQNRLNIPGVRAKSTKGVV